MIRYLLCLITPMVFAFNYSGELSLTAAQYKDDDLDSTEDNWLRPEASLELQQSLDSFEFKFNGYSRYDFADHDQEFHNLEDLWVGYEKGNFNIRLGWQTLNWTVSEAFQPADIINSRHGEGNVENFPKIGELMLRAQYRIPRGRLTFLYMPYLTDPKYPPSESRLGTGITPQKVVWHDGDEIEDGSYASQFALRLTQIFGDTDFALSYVDHLDRNHPVFAYNALAQTFTPHYFRKQQLALTVQHVWDAWLFKFEGAFRNFEDQATLTTLYGNRKIQDHSLIATGAEYVYDFENGHSATFISEFQTLQGAERSEKFDLNAFQNDLHLAIRYSFNDVNAKELTFSYITDIERDHQNLINFSYSQRLTNNFKIKLGGRYIDAPVRDSYSVPVFLTTIKRPRGIEVYHQDHQAYAKLSYFF